MFLPVVVGVIEHLAFLYFTFTLAVTTSVLRYCYANTIFQNTSILFFYFSKHIYACILLKTI